MTIGHLILPCYLSKRKNKIKYLFISLKMFLLRRITFPFVVISLFLIYFIPEHHSHHHGHHDYSLSSTHTLTTNHG